MRLDLDTPPAGPVMVSYNLDTLPTGILAKVLSYSQNPSALFFVNKRLHQQAKKFMPASLTTLEPGVTYYTVYGSVCPPNKQGQGRVITLDEVNSVREENIQSKLHFKLAELKPGKKLEKGIIYIEKINIGIHYKLIVRRPVAPPIDELEEGVINFNSLPLLECVAKKAFNVKDYEPLLERILAILQARKSIYVPVFLPIFKIQVHAQYYAAVLPFSLVHECQVKQRIVVAYGERKIENCSGRAVVEMARVYRSDIIPGTHSYPCDGNGPLEVHGSKSSCLMM